MSKLINWLPTIITVLILTILESLLDVNNTQLLYATGFLALVLVIVVVLRWLKSKSEKG